MGSGGAAASSSLEVVAVPHEGQQGGGQGPGLPGLQVQGLERLDTAAQAVLRSLMACPQLASATQAGKAADPLSMRPVLNYLGDLFNDQMTSEEHASALSRLSASQQDLALAMLETLSQHLATHTPQGPSTAALPPARLSPSPSLPPPSASGTQPPQHAGTLASPHARQGGRGGGEQQQAGGPPAPGWPRPSDQQQVPPVAGRLAAPGAVAVTVATPDVAHLVGRQQQPEPTPVGLPDAASAPGYGLGSSNWGGCLPGSEQSPWVSTSPAAGAATQAAHPSTTGCTAATAREGSRPSRRGVRGAPVTVWSPDQQHQQQAELAPQPKSNSSMSDTIGSPTHSITPRSSGRLRRPSSRLRDELQLEVSTAPAATVAGAPRCAGKPTSVSTTSGQAQQQREVGHVGSAGAREQSPTLSTWSSQGRGAASGHRTSHTTSGNSQQRSRGQQASRLAHASCDEPVVSVAGTQQDGATEVDSPDRGGVSGSLQDAPQTAGDRQAMLREFAMFDDTADHGWTSSFMQQQQQLLPSESALQFCPPPHAQPNKQASYDGGEQRQNSPAALLTPAPAPDTKSPSNSPDVLVVNASHGSSQPPGYAASDLVVFLQGPMQQGHDPCSQSLFLPTDPIAVGSQAHAKVEPGPNGGEDGSPDSGPRLAMMKADAAWLHEESEASKRGMRRNQTGSLADRAGQASACLGSSSPLCGLAYKDTAWDDMNSTGLRSTSYSSSSSSSGGGCLDAGQELRSSPSNRFASELHAGGGAGIEAGVVALGSGVGTRARTGSGDCEDTAIAAAAAAAAAAKVSQAIQPSLQPCHAQELQDAHGGLAPSPSQPGTATTSLIKGAAAAPTGDSLCMQRPGPCLDRAAGGSSGCTRQQATEPGPGVVSLAAPSTRHSAPHLAQQTSLAQVKCQGEQEQQQARRQQQQQRQQGGQPHQQQEQAGRHEEMAHQQQQQQGQQGRPTARGPVVLLPSLPSLPMPLSSPPPFSLAPGSLATPSWQPGTTPGPSHPPCGSAGQAPQQPSMATQALPAYPASSAYYLPSHAHTLPMFPHAASWHGQYGLMGYGVMDQGQGWLLPVQPSQVGSHAEAGWQSALLHQPGANTTGQQHNASQQQQQQHNSKGWLRSLTPATINLLSRTPAAQPAHSLPSLRASLTCSCPTWDAWVHPCTWVGQAAALVSASWGCCVKCSPAPAPAAPWCSPRA
ncbi:hypothetical protein V8C86DRAFT_1494613 [Haematococcus lacustris]